ncbi:hypothetical protein FQZ97_471280 [compost metagenome]
MRAVEAQLQASDEAVLAIIGRALSDGIDALEQATNFVVAQYGNTPAKVLAGSVPFLELFGIVAGGWQLARSARVAHQRLQQGSSEAGFYQAKLHTAHFYAEHLLPRAGGLAHTVLNGGDAALALDDALF